MATTMMKNTDTRDTPPTKTQTLREVDPAELKQWLDAGETIVVDVREPDEFIAERIEGAISRPLSNLNPGSVPTSTEKTVVLHCRSGKRSAEAAQRLIAAGRTEVCHLKGGLKAWIDAGLPVKKLAKAPISIMRQVQITAGSMVFIGTVLGAFVSPWFLLLSGFVGAGLVFAGVSGTCGLATMLSYMPWNKAYRGATSCST